MMADESAAAQREGKNVKKIVLIGDSIRLGYDVLVKDAYRGVADVYFTKENNCFAEYVLRFLHEWKSEMQCGDDVDCVHWNVGAWDTLTLYDDGPLTPIRVYKQYLKRICKRIRLLFPKAKVIFATSTPMDEARFLTPEVYVRRNKDVEAYNKAAVSVVKKYGIVINDLYGLMQDKPLDYHSDVAHFYTKKAATLITEKVCSVIDEALEIKADRPNYDFWFDETESYEGGTWLAKRASEGNSTETLGI